MNSLSTSSPRTRLFLVSFLILFLELACIRWFGSAVIFLTFFTNIILMACFLGMSVGLLSAEGRFDYTRWTLPVLYAAFGLAYLSLMLYQSFTQLNVDVGGQGAPQQIFFGTEYRANDPSKISIPIEVIAGVFFVLIALTFVGLGQIMGRAFNAMPDRIAAYTADIAGSICGILCFGLCSYFQLPPIVWFGVATLLYLALIGINPLRRESTPSEASSAPARSSILARPLVQIAAAVGILVFAALPDPGSPNTMQPYWSPYYKINYWPKPAYGIYTNNIGHQEMKDVAMRGPAYTLPHLLNRDAGKPAFKDVLIIGAGSGNDVQGARMFGAENIDAVEIDPVIQYLGMRDHPNQPYSDSRVHRYNDDGRSFVKKTDKKYDLVVYALVDSLVLHSGYSSLRLESFLFTRQAMEDIKSRLKPGGMFAMYNFYRQGWVVQRLVKLGEEVFESKPLVFSMPHRTVINADDSQSGSYTFILCGDTRNIEKAFAAKQNFWLNARPGYNLYRNSFEVSQPPQPKAPVTKNPTSEDERAPEPSWQRIAPAQVDVSQTTLLPDDDWPFLYLRERTIPGLNLRGMLLIGVLSLLLLWLIGVRSWSTPASATKSTPGAAPGLNLRSFNWQMFFLGAGFMLLETKSVVHMALLFGSTWIVNSFVFGAILLMILLSNLWVAKTNPRNVLPYYILLVVSLLIGLLVPMNSFLALPGAMKVLASCAIAFIPVFFAGVAFSSAFRKSRQPDVDFGCNVVGIILGGLCEFLSLAIGFNGLLGVAIAFYVLSFVLKPRESTPATE